MNADQVIAVTSPVERAGTILMWTLSGDTDRTKLAAAWASAGQDAKQLPGDPSALAVLRRGMQELVTSSRLLRALPRAAGFALVEVAAGAEADEDYTKALDFKTLVTAVVDRGLVESGMGAPLNVRTKDTDLRDAVFAFFAKHRGRLDTSDVSSWLINYTLRELSGVSLRATGGVYFVPHTSVAQLDLLVGCLNAASSHAIYRIPAMSGDDAVAAILDAIMKEADAEAAAMEADIEAAQLGERGYQNRIGRTDRIEQKVAKYEELLGVKMADIGARLERLRANLSIAMIKAAQDGEKAA